jgi:hypothetical protein
VGALDHERDAPSPEQHRAIVELEIHPVEVPPPTNPGVSQERSFAEARAGKDSRRR